MKPDDRDAYIATLERAVIDDHRGSGTLAWVFLALIAGLLVLGWAQSVWGGDHTRPAVLR
jgi:hypothetical protein